mmetsp:Transcript_73507/g.146203  ORF Transcript_73507/g.146203 Transcript_73507/m.146203 type:complete len:181 (+) Transcript_73507:7-549(+)
MNNDSRNKPDVLSRGVVYRRKRVVLTCRPTISTTTLACIRIHWGSWPLGKVEIHRNRLLTLLAIAHQKLQLPSASKANALILPPAASNTAIASRNSTEAAHVSTSAHEEKRRISSCSTMLPSSSTYPGLDGPREITTSAPCVVNAATTLVAAAPDAPTNVSTMASGTGALVICSLSLPTV